MIPTPHRHLSIFLLLFSIGTASYAQKATGQNKLLSSKQTQKIDSLLAIDWLTYPYKSLDDNYDIILDQVAFQKAMKQGGFYPERIKKYNDSLSVALFHDLKDTDAIRIARLRISYSWERLSWNLLLSQDQAKALARELHFSHPYRVKEFLSDPNNTSQIRLQLLDGLRYRVSQLEQINGVENVADLNLKQLFNRAFRYSPSRLLKVKKINAERDRRN